MPEAEYDLFVVGGGSGGVRAARWAARLGARVALAEERYLGGTCVNVGCIPKKLLSYAAHFHEDFEDALHYGWQCTNPHFDWGVLIANKDREIARLNGVYQRLLIASGVHIIRDRATIVDAHTVRANGKVIHASHILIATGGWPVKPAIPGAELGFTSNEAFYLDKLPSRMVVVGGGYIAVEFASIFNGLGSETTLVYRKDRLLRSFDADLGHFLGEQMEAKGVRILYKRDIRRSSGRRLTPSR